MFVHKRSAWLLAVCLAFFAGIPAVQAGAGFVPRLGGAAPKGILRSVRSLETGIPSEYASGASMVIFQDKLVFYDALSEAPLIRVFAQSDQGGLELFAEHTEDAPISNIVYDQWGIAYLVSGSRDGKALCLVTADINGAASRTGLGVPIHDRTPAPGSVKRLNDGRLLFTDANGVLHICRPDGSGLTALSDLPVKEFVVFNETVYFTNLNDCVTYPMVYCPEYGEYLDVTCPRLYRMQLDGKNIRRVSDCGVRGLASQGPFILYQNMDDPFIWPQAEVPEEWLYGALYRLNGISGEFRSLALDSAAYIPTPYGFAAWLMEETPQTQAQEEGSHRPAFALLMCDYEGNPLYRLDSGPLYFEECAFSLSFDGLWIYQHNDESEAYDFFGVPLDGSDTGW